MVPVRRLFVALVVCALVILLPTTPAGQAQVPAISAALADVLSGRASADDGVPVIVQLRVTAQPEGAMSIDAVSEQRNQISSSQANVWLAMPAGSASDPKFFETIPFFAARVTLDGLLALARHPGVVGIQEDTIAEATLSDSIAIIGATTAASNGHTGAGQSVAILDTGVLSTHPFLSGKVVSEACYSTTGTFSGTSSTSVCPGGVQSSTAPGSGEPCSFTGGCDHGTHVAGIAAGTLPSSNFYGVARGANIVAVQVFSQFSSGCSSGLCTWSSDYIRGLERVLAIRGTHNIASANMSLGGGGFTTQASCDSSNAATKAAIDNLRSVGVATVISSGNDGFTNAVGSPGCISTAISVGSTTKADAVSSFSNAATFVSLLAPGSSIQSSVLGNLYGYKNGTSMAAPHVAGAWAVMKAANPSASVTSVLSAFQSTGTMITDSKAPSVTRPRINLFSAVTALAPPPPTPCAFTLSPTSASVAATAGSGTVALTSNKGGCGWSAGGSSASWLSISPGSTSGTGSASVSYQFAANTTTSARSATLEMGGQVFTVTQAGATFNGCCDGNGDARTDLYWRNQSNGQLAIWFMNGRTLIDSQMLSPVQVADVNWRIEAIMDIDGDGDGDLIWHNVATGDLAVWVMNGRTLVDSQSLVPGRVADLNWSIVGAGDFNADGKSDLLWRNNVTAELAIWYMNGRTLIDSVYTSHMVADVTWRIVAVDDMDGDGDADLIWRNAGNGEMAIWFMNGRTLVDSNYLSVRFVADANWKVVGSGDFNADGRNDLIWQNDATGDLAAWYMNGRTLIDSVALNPGRVVDLNWKIIGPR